MKAFKIKKNKGFTLIETMIAVFILVIAMNGLLGLIASSLFSARYAKNELTANYLIQEAIDYIRNDRDTTAFQQMGTGGGWDNFIQNRYGDGTSTICFSNNGCEIEPSNTNPSNIVNACDGTIGGNFGSIPCRVLLYDESATNKAFYTYQNVVGAVPSKFKRRVNMKINPIANNPDELDITVTVEWQNGTLVRSKTSRVSLLNWQK